MATKSRKEAFKNTSTDALANTATAAQVSPATGATKAPEQTNEPIIVNNITMRSVDRTPKDIANWRNAHIAAESIYYPNRTRLLDLYMDVTLDGHLSGLMMKRVDTVINRKYRFVIADKEEENVCKLTRSTAFRQLLRETMMSIFFGMSGFEFIPGNDFKFKTIPRKHIKPEKKVIAINQTDFDGIPYEEIDNLWVVGEERDLGLLLKCAFYALLKKGSFSDWANYIEIFGQPMMVTKYDTYDEKTKAQLTRMMEEAGASLKLSIPKQADFEIMDGKTSNGNGDLQKQFVDACNEEMSVIVLGNTETTKSSKSSGYAQSETHSSQQNEITKSDIHYILSLLNSDKFLNILRSYGYTVEGGEFVTEDSSDEANLLTQSKVDEALKRLGLPLDDDYFYDAYNRPKPANYDLLKAEMQTEEEEDESEPNPDALPPKQPAKKPKAKQPSNLSAWRAFRLMMADFFDPALKA